MIQNILNNHFFLLPGDMEVTTKSMTINTILGSCVCVCLFDPIAKVAGINHYMLPINDSHDESQLKYGNTSLALMLKKMQDLGATIPNMKASVIGGSSLFFAQSDRFSIGKSNIQIAMEFLSFNKIKIVLNETGGTIGRKLVFDTGTGTIIHNLLKSQNGQNNQSK